MVLMKQKHGETLLSCASDKLLTNFCLLWHDYLLRSAIFSNFPLTFVFCSFFTAPRNQPQVLPGYFAGFVGTPGIRTKLLKYLVKTWVESGYFRSIVGICR